MDRSGDAAAFDAEWTEFAVGGDLEVKSTIEFGELESNSRYMTVKSQPNVCVRDCYQDGHRMVEVYDIISGEGIKVRNIVTENSFGLTFEELEGWKRVLPAPSHGRSNTVDRLIREL